LWGRVGKAWAWSALERFDADAVALAWDLAPLIAVAVAGLLLTRRQRSRAAGIGAMVGAGTLLVVTIVGVALTGE
jgi:hypothetical protein